MTRRFRLKNGLDIRVLAMSAPGTLKWQAGDFIVIEDGVPHVVAKEIATLFLEPDSESGEVGDHSNFVPVPPEPARKRVNGAGYPKPNHRQSPVTTWRVDGRKPLQVMQGRILIRLFDATRADGLPIRLKAFVASLPQTDRGSGHARIRELNIDGYVTMSMKDARKHVALSDLGGAGGGPIWRTDANHAGGNAEEPENPCITNQSHVKPSSLRLTRSI